MSARLATPTKFRALGLAAIAFVTATTSAMEQVGPH